MEMALCDFEGDPIVDTCVSQFVSDEFREKLLKDNGWLFSEIDIYSNRVANEHTIEEVAIIRKKSFDRIETHE